MITSVRSVSLIRFAVKQAASRKSSLPVTTTSVGACIRGGAVCHFSSSSGSNKKTSFRPRRRPSENYRPLKTTSKKRKGWRFMKDIPPVQLGKVENPRDELEAAFGPDAAEVIRDIRREKEDPSSLDEQVEEHLRMADYMVAEQGSTEDLVGERRALAHMQSEKEREDFMRSIEAIVAEERIQNMDLDEDELQDDQKKSDVFASLLKQEDAGVEADKDDPDVWLDRNQLAHGEWSEMLVQVDRNIKLWRGGRLESYRALVIGGNLNGCGGFGIGKSQDPIAAVNIAGRRCKKNIFFVDRYQDDGLTGDLVGKQNNCKVILLATDNGLRGNPLCREILKRFGITNCSAKAFGRRSPYNVTRATFKALMTHESLEDIALKRGKRLVSIDRAKRLQV